MKIFLSCLLTVALLGPLDFLTAQEVKPPAPYQSATKSSFTPPAKGRNPFWPIGFWPRPASEKVVLEDQLLRIPVETYRVSSIVLGNPSMALINGKPYTEGQFLTVATATGSVKILIKRIQDGSIVLTYKKLQETVPISRR